MEEKLDQLFQRLDDNFSDFQKQWETQSKYELLYNSREITAVRDAHEYLTYIHGFEADEVDYLLKFDNPLEVVADKWCERTEDLSDFPFVLDEVFEKRDALRDYPQKEKPAAERPSVLAKLRGMSNMTANPHAPGTRGPRGIEDSSGGGGATERARGGNQPPRDLAKSVTTKGAR